MLPHKNLTVDGLPQVRLAKAMGNSVTAISTSPSKEAAAREIGADKWDQQEQKQTMKKKQDKKQTTKLTAF